MSVTPNDICRFLVWNDKFGKTQIYGMSCPHIGEFGIFQCGCAIRLAAGTVHGMVQTLSEILCRHGRGRSWDVGTGSGNPCMSSEVQSYEKSCKDEQAKSRI